jgi:uroporphyrinogen decarboxylase
MVKARADYRRCVEDAIRMRSPRYLPYEIHVDERRFARETDAATYREVQSLAADAPPFLLHLWDGSNDYFDHDEYVDSWGIHWTDGRPSPSHHLSIQQDPAPPRSAHSEWVRKAERLAGGRAGEYTLGHVWFTLFERLHLLYGFQTALLMPYLHPDRFAAIMERLLRHDLQEIEIFLQLGVDGIFFSDDWGTQQGLIMGRDDWLRHFAPAYERLFRPVAQAGKDIWFHSCGNIMELIPQLLALGVNVLNPVQSSVLDIGELAQRFGGRICFFGGLDTQHFLPKADPASTARQIRTLAKTLGRSEGGYIGGTSHTILPDVPLENVRAVYRTFAELAAAP